MLILEVANEVVVDGELAVALLIVTRPRRTADMSPVVLFQIAHLVEALVAPLAAVWARVPFHVLLQVPRPIEAFGALSTRALTTFQ